MANLLKNPVTFFLILIFTLVNIGDTVTTYFVMAGESNPLFNLVGQYWFVIVFKILFVGLAWWLYAKNEYLSKFIFFMFILVLVLGNLLIGMAVYGNIYGMMNPQLIEEASQIPVGERTTAYVQFVSIIYILPMLLCMAAYKLHELGLRYTKVKNGAKQKKKDTSSTVDNRDSSV